MVAWAQKSGVITGEDFFTRRVLDSHGNWSKRSLLVKDVRIASESLGLSGTFSMSHGSRDELWSRSNHSGKSNTSERVYQYRMSGPGTLAVGDLNVGPAALSATDCLRIDAASSDLPPTCLHLGTEALWGLGGNPL